MKKFLRINASCIAFGRTMQAGTMIDLETITDHKKLADMSVIVGAGLAEIIERYPVEPEPEKAPAPAPEKTQKKEAVKSKKKKK